MNDAAENGFFIKRINEILEKKANNTFQAIDLTFAQTHMIFMLYQSEGNICSLKELEKHFHAAQSTVAGTVARLEKKKLVEGFADADDRRVKMVRLTELGRMRCLEARKGMLETERLIVSNMTKEEAGEFNRLLRIVYDTIR